MTVPATQATSDNYIALIERALHDPDVDVDKLQRLLDIREIETNRAAEKAFNSALVMAQAEMRPINTDASNPQTRSRYATFGALDRECRPIYTKFGLGPSFNTEPTTDPNTILVVCLLGHREGHTRRYQIPMPIDTKGARGGDVMTRTHATGSAFSYGKRYLLAGMFNLAIDDDNDGNTVRRAPPQVRRDIRPMQHYQQDDGLIDPETGEVIEATDPYTIEMGPGSTWAQFLEPLQRYILSAKTIEEIDAWMLKNQDLLLKLKDSKPQLFRLFEKNIEPKKSELSPPAE
jgi:hypothetical protein